MRLFECQHCGQPLYFENGQCQGCGRRLGYIAAMHDMSALDSEPVMQGAAPTWTALADGRRYRFCSNAAHASCNWLIPADSPDEFCEACRHNRMIPDLTVANNLKRWQRIEIAKHRLFYTLLRLGLWLPTPAEHPEGLVFDFLADPPDESQPKVMTGHEQGLITINLAEADDAEREKRRHDMGETYRTLLGHFRHEVGHWIWDRLVRDRNCLGRFRELFGDERVDYGLALQAHYDNGPPANWQEWFVSGYASAHPWEDFAETWAHYLHIVDTLETANAFGLRVRPRIARGTEIAARINFDPHEAGDMGRLVDAWLPLTFAVNSLNRSMGQPDLYPFVLSPAAIVKLTFVHEMVHAATGRRSGGNGVEGALTAVVAGLRSPVGAPG